MKGVDALGYILLVAIGGAIALSLVGIVRSSRQRRAEAEAASAPRWWDVFLSYKSQNANEVRRIAEALMAAGHRVWFAEYEVLLANYADFERLISEGIGKSSFAVLFTTPDYAGSKYCRLEAELAKSRFANAPERILEVVLKRNSTRELLGLPSDSPRFTGRVSSEMELLEWLASRTGLAVDRPTPDLDAGAGSNRFHAHCAPISFATDGFDLVKRTQHRDGTDIAYFLITSAQTRCRFNVYFHFDPQAAPGVPLKLGGTFDDQVLYTQLRNYASWFMREMRARGKPLREHGLHAVWIGPTLHLGITHSFRWVRSTRMRKYAINLNELAMPIQIVFTFEVIGADVDFFRHVKLMDNVVASVRVERG